MGVVVTTGERGAGGFERGFGAALGAGDNLVAMSVGGEKVWLHRV